MSRKNNFTNFHDIILDQFKDKEILSGEEVRRLHTWCMTEYCTESEFSDFDRILLNDIKIINGELRKQNLRIIRGLDEDTGENFYILVNRCHTTGECWERLNVWNENLN